MIRVATVVLFVSLTSCETETALERAVDGYSPEETITIDDVTIAKVEADQWDSQRDAVYAEKLFREYYPSYKNHLDLRLAHDRGMVKALLEDRVENPKPEITEEEIEGASGFFRASAMKPSLHKFSAISVFARSKVGQETRTAQERKEAIARIAPTLAPYRLELMRNPTHDRLRRVKEKLSSSLPDEFGTAIRVESKVLANGEPDDGRHLSHQTLARTLVGLHVGDVPEVVVAGFTAMLVINEGPVTHEKQSEEEIRALAIRSLEDKILVDRLVALVDAESKTINSKMHPKVISDRTSNE